jgi:hypothetical protein
MVRHIKAAQVQRQAPVQGVISLRTVAIRAAAGLFRSITGGIVRLLSLAAEAIRCVTTIRMAAALPRLKCSRDGVVASSEMFPGSAPNAEKW